MSVTITRQAGIAGQIAFTAHTDEGDFTFVGSVYGGPVVVITPTGHQSFVTNPGRFGEFGRDWVRKFIEAIEPPTIGTL